MVPDLDECDSRSGILRQILGLGRYFKRSLIYHGHRLKKLGFHGMGFPHTYVDGIRSLFHPSYAKVKRELESVDFDLFTLTKSEEEEADYDDIIRFTDWIGKETLPRTMKNYKTHIAMHRGCGPEPLEID